MIDLRNANKVINVNNNWRSCKISLRVSVIDVFLSKIFEKLLSKTSTQISVSSILSYLQHSVYKIALKSLIKTAFKLTKVITIRGVSRTLFQNVVSDIGRMQILFSLPLSKLLKLYYHGGVFLVC